MGDGPASKVLAKAGRDRLGRFAEGHEPLEGATRLGVPNRISGQIRVALETGALEMVPELLSQVRAALIAGDTGPALVLMKIILPSITATNVSFDTVETFRAYIAQSLLTGERREGEAIEGEVVEQKEGK